MLIDFRELFPRYNLKFSGVLHIGANVGEEAPIYLELGIKKQIWIEGNPDVFLKLKHNVSGNPQATALNYLIGDENRDAVFHISNNGSQSSSVLELGTHSKVHPEVSYVNDINLPMNRIDSLGLDLSGVDLLNIDLQGAELMALKGMGDLLRGFKAAYLEVNKDYLYKGCPLVEDLDLFMIAFNFRRVETKWCGNTNWGDALYINGSFKHS
jgi:FkbM family methyltransferase